jgi:hypothetical protein
VAMCASPYASTTDVFVRAAMVNTSKPRATFFFCLSPSFRFVLPLTRQLQHREEIIAAELSFDRQNCDSQKRSFV